MDRQVCLSLVALILGTSATAQLASQNDQTAHFIEVGARKMFLNCTGNSPGLTVILEAGTGDSSEVWSAVQKQVEQFAHVYSYDRLGLGRSEKPAVAHTADEIVGDLHQLFQAIGGIYVRKYAARYPTEVTGG